MMTTQAEFDSTLYRTAVAQLDEVAKKVDLEPDIHERLRHPRRALVVSVPVRMDDSRTEVFYGYRVHHKPVLGPTKGGLRFAPDVNLGEVTALAMLLMMDTYSIRAGPATVSSLASPRWWEARSAAERRPAAAWSTRCIR